MSEEFLVDGPTGLTADWLGRVLAADVASLSVTSIGTGQTGASYRLGVVYVGPAQLPATFVAKLPAEDPSVRERVAYGYRAEVDFYETVAPTLAVPLPRCYLSSISPDAQNFVLLLADLAPAVQGDQLAGCAPDAARAAVVALAGLHGPRWCDPKWTELASTVMPTSDAQAAAGLADLARMAADMFLERLGDRMTELNRQTLHAFPKAVAPWLLLHPNRYALLHGDYRLDNLMFSPDGSVTVVDWQTISVGLPARDLAYFLSTSLHPEDRRAHERDLVAAYHGALLQLGVTDYAAEECWRDYCLGMLHSPLIATLGAAFSTTTERGDAMMLVMLDRACTAIRELDTLALIDEESVRATQFRSGSPDFAD
ncbi:MAG: phosphotransferase [Acidimicrobiales bacterium]